MKVILLQDFPSLGFIGDISDVANGYARNYLIPRGIAIADNASGFVKNKVENIQRKKAKLKVEAEALADKLRNFVITKKMKIGESGKAFGSITTKDLEANFKENNFEISKKQLTLSEQIKGVGNYNLIVRLHSEVSVEVTVKVEAENKDN